jgi:GNAT superfamily N-acetyltransferase
MATSPAGPIRPEHLTIVPANEATWADLSAIFDAPDSSQCGCQRFKTGGRFWDQATDDQRRARLREQTNCDDPEATTSTGLVAYLAQTGSGAGDRAGRGTPVGWVAVEPRAAYPRLQGMPTVWHGRQGEDKKDDSVWSVTCFVVRKGYRRRGLSYALAAATIPYAKANGARALEAYAMRTQPGKEITWESCAWARSRCSPTRASGRSAVRACAAR